MKADPADNKKWHVIYTRSRAEKKVVADLINQEIECFLPLQKKLRQWKDRKKWVETPLISGYCFVRINRKDYDRVLQTDNVVCYITFEGKAAVIPSRQIDGLKKMTQQFDFEVSVSQENFKPGQKVEIIAGPMTGIQGELIKCQNQNRFILRIEQIKTVFSVEIPAQNLTALPKQK
ncbi:MAG TPA: UpxY family transcription antiterminator [Tangfeifania sp.]|nr:UpxY family transcription antiterminator [Tangfeifania sp.]